MTTTKETPEQALERIQSGQSIVNYPKIIAEFAARGIPEDDICPRTNVLTYKAWKAKGRAVMRGEKGVKICTFRPVFETDKGSGEKKQTGSRPWFSTVFHISQTTEMVGRSPMGRKAQKRAAVAAARARVVEVKLPSSTGELKPAKVEQPAKVERMETGSLFG